MFGICFGSPSWARTSDLRINSPSLYRLSYRGTGRGAELCTKNRKNAKRVENFLSGVLNRLGCAEQLRHDIAQQTVAGIVVAGRADADCRQWHVSRIA